MGNGMGRAGSTEKKELRVEEKKCKNLFDRGRMAMLWHEWNGKSKKMNALVCEVNLL